VLAEEPRRKPRRRRGSNAADAADGEPGAEDAPDQSEEPDQGDGTPRPPPITTPPRANTTNIDDDDDPYDSTARRLNFGSTATGQEFDVDPLVKNEQPNVAIDVKDVIPEDEDTDRERSWRAAQQHSMLSSENQAHRQGRIAERSRETIFYENVFTGAFEQVDQTVTLKRTETHDQDWEEQVMKVGVEVFLYMETTVAMFSKGLLAGMSLLALNASYGRCNESEFTFCYAVTAGHTIRLFYFLMNVCSIVALIQYNQVTSADPTMHAALMGLSCALYWISWVLTVIFTPVDDKVLEYADTVRAGQTDLVDVSAGLLTEQFWHVANVARLSMLTLAWVLTCIDRVFMTIVARKKAEEKRRIRMGLA